MYNFHPHHRAVSLTSTQHIRIVEGHHTVRKEYGLHYWSGFTARWWGHV